MTKTKYYIILIIFLISLIGSIILSIVPVEKACGSNQTGCYQVQTSNYEKIFGIKNSHLGLIAFGILSLITFCHIRKPQKIKKNLITLGIVTSLIFSLYFIYLQIFVLKAFCKYCMTVDIGSIINFLVIIFWREK